MEGALMDLALHLGRHCSDRQDALCKALDLSKAEIACLRAIASAEGVACGPLARAMELSPSRSTRVVDALVRRGMVERSADGEDRRRCLVRPTANGARAIARITRYLADCERSLRGALSPADQSEAERGMRLMLRALDAAAREEAIDP